MTDKDIEVIVKPIFTKMFNANFSACEYGIECYKKGMEYQGIKELAIENDNLLTKAKELLKKLYKETIGYINNEGFDMNVINEVYDFINSEVEK